MTTTQMLSSHDLKYLLSEFERRLRMNRDSPLTLAAQESPLTSDYEVEPIWLQNPSGKMHRKTKRLHEEHAHRIGNLTLTSKAWNRHLSNRSCNAKKRRSKNQPCYAM